MPNDCKIKGLQQKVVSNGRYKVRECRKGFLLVDIEGITYKLKNPFDYVPDSVNVVKKNGAYCVKKYKE